MKKLILLLTISSSAVFAQEVKVEKEHRLSPKEEKAVQNKIQTPVQATDKKVETKKEAGKVVTKTVEVKSGQVAVPEKKAAKKKHKKVIKK